MRPSGDEERGDKVAHLLRIVEHLHRDDQQRICKIVRLLMLLPASDQDETFLRLRRLLEQAPGTRNECSRRVDDVIDFLEARLKGHDEPATAPATH